MKLIASVPLGQCLRALKLKYSSRKLSNKAKEKDNKFSVPACFLFRGRLPFFVLSFFLIIKKKDLRHKKLILKNSQADCL